MTARIASSLPAAAATATVLAMCLQPALAQYVGPATTLLDAYHAPVEDLPTNCAYVGAFGPIDGGPRVRPQVVKAAPQTNPDFATARVVPSQLGSAARKVAYGYSFTHLAQKIPPSQAGIFTVQSVRTIVHLGPTASNTIISDLTRYGVDNVLLSNSVAEANHAVSVFTPPYYNTWLVRNIAVGSLQVSDHETRPNFTIEFQCVVPVQPL